jgi:nitrate reductase alpha subunit
VPERLLRASDFDDALAQENNPDWKTIGIDDATGNPVVPTGSIGFRWGEQGKWNLEEKDADGAEVKLRVGLKGAHDDVAEVLFPYFANTASNGFASTDHPDTLMRRIPVKRLALKDGEKRWWPPSTISSWPITASIRDSAASICRRPTTTSSPTRRLGPSRSRRCRASKSSRSRAVCDQRREDQWQVDGDHRRGDEPLVSHGHELSRGDQSPRDVRLHRPVRWRLVALCRPGEIAPANRLGAARVRARLGAPPRQQNSTSFFYAHTDQWRYETLDVKEILSPTAPEGDWGADLHRLQRQGRAHGLVAVRAGAQDQSARGRESRAPARASIRANMRRAR